MSKILVLRPGRDTFRPVLMLEASLRLDSFLLSLRNLERLTNLKKFKRIYVLTQGATEEHAALLHKFNRKHGPVCVIACGQNHSAPGLDEVRLAIQAENPADVIVRIGEGVFVTPGWLDHLADAYRVHRLRPDIPLVGALSPVSQAGGLVLNRFLRAAYPAERAMFEGGPVEENWVYHRWMWTKVVDDHLMEMFANSQPPPYSYPDVPALDCVAYDHRLMEILADGVAWNEAALGEALAARGRRSAVASRAVAHRYASPSCEDYLRAHVGLDRIWDHLQDMHQRFLAQPRQLVLRTTRPAPDRVAGLNR